MVHGPHLPARLPAPHRRGREGGRDRAGPTTHEAGLALGGEVPSLQSFLPPAPHPGPGPRQVRRVAAPPFGPTEAPSPSSEGPGQGLQEATAPAMPPGASATQTLWGRLWSQPGAGPETGVSKARQIAGSSRAPRAWRLPGLGGLAGSGRGDGEGASQAARGLRPWAAGSAAGGGRAGCGAAGPGAVRGGHPRGQEAAGGLAPFDPVPSPRKAGAADPLALAPG